MPTIEERLALLEAAVFGVQVPPPPPPPTPDPEPTTTFNPLPPVIAPGDMAYTTAHYSLEEHLKSGLVSVNDDIVWRAPSAHSHKTQYGGLTAAFFFDTPGLHKVECEVTKRDTALKPTGKVEGFYHLITLAPDTRPPSPPDFGAGIVASGTRCTPAIKSIKLWNKIRVSASNVVIDLSDIDIEYVGGNGPLSLFEVTGHNVVVLGGHYSAPAMKAREGGITAFSLNGRNFTAVGPTFSKRFAKGYDTPGDTASKEQKGYLILDAVAKSPEFKTSIFDIGLVWFSGTYGACINADLHTSGSEHGLGRSNKQHGLLIYGCTVTWNAPFSEIGTGRTAFTPQDADLVSIIRNKVNRGIPVGPGVSSHVGDLAQYIQILDNQLIKTDDVIDVKGGCADVAVEGNEVITWTRDMKTHPLYAIRIGYGVDLANDAPPVRVVIAGTLTDAAEMKIVRKPKDSFLNGVPL